MITTFNPTFWKVYIVTLFKHRTEKLKKKMNKKEKMYDLNCVLPHDSMVDILLRQPVKSLVRFKGVSTTWRSFISSPHFTKTHFQLDPSPTHRLLLNKINHGSEVESLDLQPSLGDPSAVVTLTFSAPYFRTLGSCRGFLLLAKKLAPSLDDLIVWNPSTGCHKKIPFSNDHWHSWYDPSLIPNIRPLDLLSSDLYFRRGDDPPTPEIPPFYMLDTDLHGFGYDPSKDDYLLVVIRLGESHPPQVTDRIGVLSLKTNVPSFYGLGVEYMQIGPWALTGLYFNQTLHWCVVPEENHSDTVIIAFDLVERSLSEIRFSHDLDVKLSKYSGYHLGVLGGCLSVCYSAEGVWYPEEGDADDVKKTEIWVMKEYKVQDSWTKTFVISVNYVPRRFLPIWSIEGGGVLGADETGILLKFNDKGELLESHAYGIHDRFSLKHFEMYRQSLLTLPDDDFEEGNEDA